MVEALSMLTGVAAGSLIVSLIFRVCVSTLDPEVRKLLEEDNDGN